MRPDGFNYPCVARGEESYRAEPSVLKENMPRKGRIAPGRVVWLDHELCPANEPQCRVYCEGIGFFMMNSAKLTALMAQR